MEKSNVKKTCGRKFHKNSVFLKKQYLHTVNCIYFTSLEGGIFVYELQKVIHLC